MIIYDEPSGVYHDSEAIGSGDVRAYLRSAALFRDQLDGICEEESDALLFGIKSHMALLEPKRFEHEIAIKPDGMSFATTEGKLWKANHKGKLVVKADEAVALTRMHQRMPAEVRKLFDTCATEVTVRNEMDGLLVQCRPDLIRAGDLIFFDLKTIGAIEKVESTIWERGYHVQLEWYRRVLFAECGKKYESRLIFVESAPPHRWKICDLDADYRAIAAESVDTALHGIKARMKSGCWDDEDGVHELVSPPRWAEGMIPEMADTEEEI